MYKPALLRIGLHRNFFNHTLWGILVACSLWLAYESCLRPTHQTNKLKKAIENILQDTSHLGIKEAQYILVKKDNHFRPYCRPLLSFFDSVFLSSNKIFCSWQGNIFIKKKIHRGDSVVYNLKKIFYFYPIQNAYLKNHVSGECPSEFDPVLNLSEGQYKITLNGNSLFVRFQHSYQEKKSFWAWLLWWISMLWIVGTAAAANRWAIPYAMGFLQWLGMFSGRMPDVFYHNEWYNSLLYYSGIYGLRHSGDVLLVLSIPVLFLMFFTEKQSVLKTNDALRRIIVLLFIPLLTWMGAYYLQNLNMLVQPEKFSEFHEVPSIVLFMIWTTLTICFAFFFRTGGGESGSLFQKLMNSAYGVLYVLFLYNYKVPWPVLGITGLILLGEIFFFPLIFSGKLRVWIVSGFLTSLIFTGILVPANYNKSLKYMKAFASVKMTDKDEIMEAEFLEVPLRLEKDSAFLNLLEFSPKEELIHLMEKNIWIGYFRKYQLHHSLFNERCEPQWKTDHLLLQNLDAIRELIARRSDSTLSEHLWLVRWPDGNRYYLSLLPVKNRTLATLFVPLPIGEAGTLSDLFSDSGTGQLLRKSGAAFALYRNGVLLESAGISDVPRVLPKNPRFHEKNKTIWFNENYIMMVSFPPLSLLHILNISLILSGIHGFLLVLIVLFLLQWKGTVLSFTFQEKLLFYFSLFFVLIILLILVYLRYNIQNQFTSEIFNRLKEKYSTLIKVTSPVFDDDQDFSYLKDPLDFILKKISFEYPSDFIFYDLHGKQQLTTLEKLNKFGIRDYFLPIPVAFIRDGNLHTSTEWAGNLMYYCLYGPAITTFGQPKGYFAIPFFPSRTEIYRMQDELINKAVNLGILIASVAIFLTAILSSYIVRPLQILTSRLRSERPVWETEKLDWKSDDEIGTLVNAYNSMLEQLKQNIVRLSEQEREMAWREMARQIAHEIKNPLTPIRLNIQHLMHLYKKNPPRFHEKFLPSAQAILEQIDSLTSIATEFSHFAKISSEPFEAVDVNECIRKVAGLYSSSLHILLSLPEPPVMLHANRNQLYSVFNNLLENARQATQNVSHPVVEIRGYVQEKSYHIIIQDNGPGIPTEIQNKLFTPYFTTKTSGTGLGLAIVKRIMQHHGGEITLEPTPPEQTGARFHLVFPLVPESVDSEK